jgi:hypothetical protein
MIVKYTPEDPADGDAREWTFNSKRVRASACVIIEKQWGGGDFDEWRDAVLKGETHARRVLLWHLLKLENPTFRFGDTPDFMYDELTVDADAAELREMRAQVSTLQLGPGKTEDDRARLLAAIDAEIAEKSGAEVEDPKAS